MRFGFAEARFHGIISPAGRIPIYAAFGVVCFCIGKFMEITGATSVLFYARTDSTGGLNSGPAAVDSERLDRAHRAPVSTKAKYAAWTNYYSKRMNRDVSAVRSQSMIESYPVTKIPASNAGGLALFSLMGPRYNPGRLFNAYA